MWHVQNSQWACNGPTLWCCFLMFAASVTKKTLFPKWILPIVIVAMWTKRLKLGSYAESRPTWPWECSFPNEHKPLAPFSSPVHLLVPRSWRRFECSAQVKWRQHGRHLQPTQPLLTCIGNKADGHKADTVKVTFSVDSYAANVFKYINIWKTDV